ncbi:hypothetical protein HBI84_250030, partial [Parastagonospora nodorum]
TMYTVTLCNPKFVAECLLDKPDLAPFERKPGGGIPKAIEDFAIALRTCYFAGALGNCTILDWVMYILARYVTIYPSQNFNVSLESTTFTVLDLAKAVLHKKGTLFAKVRGLADSLENLHRQALDNREMQAKTPSQPPCT